MKSFDFTDLVLLIGTNPLPNFVTADYFLLRNKNIQKIWLIHSVGNEFQAGTSFQANYLEKLLRKRWGNENAPASKYQNLKFPLEKISLTDVSDGDTIRREIELKMLKEWHQKKFHLNYTGGTKAMATHVYKLLQELSQREKHPFSYLDANNFRLVLDNYGVIYNDKNADLRKCVQLKFEDLIALHGFEYRKVKSQAGDEEIKMAHEKFFDMSDNIQMNGRDGIAFEQYLWKELNDRIGNQLNNLEGVSHDRLKGEENVLHNWQIWKSSWKTRFELDIIFIHGYHFTGASVTVSGAKGVCKRKGFEIILRTRQIGGDEARAILICRADIETTRKLQDELAYETGGDKKNILVFGVDDLRDEKKFIEEIKEFVME